MDAFLRVPGADGAHRDAFDTVARLGALLREPPVSEADQARLKSGLDAAIGELDGAMDNLNTARGRVGTRLQLVEGSRAENEGIATELTRASSAIEDVDIAEAVTRLESRAFALEVLQKSWARVENLSLFNYL